MHGEYKVPGGKLVVADVEVTGEGDAAVLSEVVISGDFFLEPPEAIMHIRGALQGMPAGASAAELSQVVAAAASEATMVGFTPEAVGIAVRRALGKATSWQDHEFEIIHGEPQEPAMQVALEDVLAEAVAAGRRKPCLRIWEWERNTVVIGSFQSVRNEIDPEGAERHGMTIQRRQTGGGAMFIQPGNTITYALYVPDSLVEGLNFEQSYKFLDDWIIGALAELGIEATYVPLNDITSPAGKIAGAAQKRYASGAVLHHVTMAYDIDSDAMMETLRIGREKLSDKGTKSANKRVDPLRSQTGMSREAVLESFLDFFARKYDATRSDLTEEELAEARRLVDTKYGTEEWRQLVP